MYRELTEPVIIVIVKWRWEDEMKKEELGKGKLEKLIDVTINRDQVVAILRLACRPVDVCLVTFPDESFHARLNEF